MSKLPIQRFHSRKPLYHKNIRRGKMFNAVADAATLAKAHAGAPDQVLDPNRVYQEVELK